VKEREKRGESLERRAGRSLGGSNTWDAKERGECKKTKKPIFVACNKMEFQGGTSERGRRTGRLTFAKGEEKVAKEIIVALKSGTHDISAGDCRGLKAACGTSGCLCKK